MVSKRNFIVMTVMMLVLLFLFQFTRVSQENKNNYSQNVFYKEKLTTGELQWRQNNQDNSFQVVGEDGVSRQERIIMFVGDKTGNCAKVVQQWCSYVKNTLYFYQNLQEMALDELTGKEMVLVEPEFIQYNVEYPKLKKITEAGATLVFCYLPEVSVIEKSQGLQKLLGVRQITQKNVHLSGIKLFTGFLLGDEVVYMPEKPQEEKMQDLELNVPWFQVDTGSKTYMTGLLEDEEVENEDLPPIIWRMRQDKGYVFAINGNYMSDITGMGILSAIVTETNSYSLYPIVNAQCTTILDFPGFADENADIMDAIYSRNQNTIGRDILLPSLIAFSRREKMKMTAFMMPQADYEDDIEPSGTLYNFYLQQFYQNNVEAAASLAIRDNVNIETKVKKDWAFYTESNADYRLAAAYITSDNGLKRALAMKELKDIHTLLRAGEENIPLLSYFNGTTTQVCTVNDALNHTYAADLKMRSIQTALGYSNISLDLHKVFWPEKAEDRWELMVDRIFSNISTYWRPFRGFEQLTASECDVRVREFLNLRYAHFRAGDVVRMDVEGFQEEAWFLLRTHNQRIAKITGAEYTVFDSENYILRVTEPKVVILLEENLSNDLLKN